MSKITTVKEWLHIVYMAVGIIASLAGASVVYFKTENSEKTSIEEVEIVPIEQNKTPVIALDTIPKQVKIDTVITVKKIEIVSNPSTNSVKEKKPSAVKNNENLGIVKEEVTPVKEEPALFGITRNKKKIKDSTSTK